MNYDFPHCSLYIGPMFSEKTTQLIRDLSRSCIAELNCVLVKYGKDTRYTDKTNVICTHWGGSITDGNRLRVVSALKLSDVEIGEDERVIGIDEGQFFPDLPEMVLTWMRSGKRIYISALDGDFKRRNFGRIHEIIPYCNKVIKLKAICMIWKNDNASYTIRLTYS